jgi:acylphosphatase
MPRAKKTGTLAARRYFIQGRVQGVGFRYFAESVAAELGMGGYARNLDDGRVEVYAVGTADQLAAMSGYMWKGPRMAEVRGVQEMDAAVEDFNDFRIEYFS